jgi:hypothetical protein
MLAGIIKKIRRLLVLFSVVKLSIMIAVLHMEYSLWSTSYRVDRSDYLERASCVHGIVIKRMDP